jgi:cysteinyl-tRNA synthetase
VLAALEDDINTPEAIAELFGVVKATNRATEPLEKRALAESLRAGAWLLGLLTQDPEIWFKGVALPPGKSMFDMAPRQGRDMSQSDMTGMPLTLRDDAEIDSLVKQRDAFKRQRNFKEADLIRDRLAAQGIVIEDTPQGARWRRGR